VSKKDDDKKRKREKRKRERRQEEQAKLNANSAWNKVQKLNAKNQKNVQRLHSRVNNIKERFFQKAASGDGPTTMLCPCEKIAKELGVVLPNRCEAEWEWIPTGSATIPLPEGGVTTQNVDGFVKDVVSTITNMSSLIEQAEEQAEQQNPNCN
jgi:hypothetical protein